MVGVRAGRIVAVGHDVDRAVHVEGQLVARGRFHLELLLAPVKPVHCQGCVVSDSSPAGWAGLLPRRCPVAASVAVASVGTAPGGGRFLRRRAATGGQPQGGDDQCQ